MPAYSKDFGEPKKMEFIANRIANRVNIRIFNELQCWFFKESKVSPTDVYPKYEIDAKNNFDLQC